METTTLELSAPTRAKDTIFRQPIESVEDFKFNHKVAAVFDDMVERSVPYYAEMQRMILEMAQDYAVDHSNIYDLGCATGTTLAGLSQCLGQRATLVGVDNSDDMLSKCREKLQTISPASRFNLVQADLNNFFEINHASMVIMVLTLQFVRPLRRQPLMSAIYRGLNRGGCLIWVEKVLGEDPLLNRRFIEYYYRLKRSKGYSEMEIAKKREALENVLVPYTLLENRDLALQAGFQSWDVFFKWNNFCGMIATKL